MGQANPWVLNSRYLVRTSATVTVGKLVAITDFEVLLEDSGWISNAGRLSDAILRAKNGEVEPLSSGDVIISRYAIIDAVVIAPPPTNTGKGRDREKKGPKRGRSP